ncbi:MAG: hypothetical protein ABSD59_16835 [Terracidiphilus sp.]|jgi:hypothetical protein
MSIRRKVTGILLSVAAAASWTQQACGAQRGFQPITEEPSVKSSRQ